MGHYSCFDIKPAGKYFVRMLCLVENLRLFRRAYHHLGKRWIVQRMMHREADQQENVLHELNNLSVAELKEFRNIGSEKAQRLVAYREDTGQLRSIGDLINIDGFTDRVIDSIKKEGLLKRKAKGYRHVLHYADAKNVISVAAIGIGRNQIQWCLITRDLEVTNWASSILSPSKKYDPREFITEIKQAMSKIPSADIKVVEAQSFKSSSKDPFLFPYILRNRLTEAIIHAVSKERTVTFDPNIIKKHFQLSKGFNKQYYSVPLVNTLVQEMKRKRSRSPNDMDENIDLMNATPENSDLVMSLVDDHTDIRKELTNIKIPRECIEHFKERKQKDGLANVLLTACAFMQIEVLDREETPTRSTERFKDHIV